MVELFAWLRILNLELFSTTDSKERQEHSIFLLPVKKLAFIDNNDVISVQWKEKI